MRDAYTGNQFKGKEININMDEYNGIANILIHIMVRTTNNLKKQELIVINWCLITTSVGITNLLWSDESNGVKIPATFTQ